MRLRAFACAAVLLSLSTPARAAIATPARTPPPVAWALDALKAELRAHGIAASQAQVSVEVANVPEPQDQAFALRKDGARIVLHGGGPVGAMYAVQELTERLHHAAPARTWAELAAQVQPTEQSPWVAVRADNAFIHLHPLLIDDVGMWRRYIDMLARDRFNLLDLHGSYDLESTGFFNLYPMLVDVPGYPGVGRGIDKAKNLDHLRAIVAYARSRGVRVALMNYSIAEAPPPGRRRAKADPQIEGVRPDKVADYTAKATAALIRALPDLYMLGFRVGETGQPASFFKDAYLKGVALSGRKDLRLYARSWLTTKDELEPIAEAAPGRFDVEIKYNGEHLGLPYPALQERFATYSYQHYLDVPMDYRILWQVRANGTHRFWAWEDTDFIRRTARTFRLGDAGGFTLEPPTAYFSVDPRQYYRSAQDQQVHDYAWEKHWAWWFAWGRLGYDPELPEAVLRSAYADHFGAAAGPRIYNAMQKAGAIVPLAYAYRFVGADQRDYSPETETGYSANDTIVGSRTPIPDTLLQYAQDQAQDQRSFVPIDAFVQEKMDGVADGRLGPFAVSARLRQASADTLAALDAVGAPDPKAAGAWRLLETDLRAAAELGAYHADRIEGLTWLDHGLRTNERADVDKAKALLAASRTDWSRLAATADAVYRPLQNPMRHQRDFTWASQLPMLEKTDAELEPLWEARAKGAHKNPLKLVATDDGGAAGLDLAEPPAHVMAPSGRSMRFTVRPASKAPLSRVVLWWKPLPSDARWRPQEMVVAGDGYAAEVPWTSEGLMYLVELQDASGDARNIPLEPARTPYWIVPPEPQPASGPPDPQARR